jgi:ferredoxin
MANKADKWAQNAAGKFYVDQQCIDCDLCRETAPNFFTRNDEGGHSFVHKQPETEEDIAQCMEALEGCPWRPSATTATRNRGGPRGTVPPDPLLSCAQSSLTEACFFASAC